MNNINCITIRKRYSSDIVQERIGLIKKTLPYWLIQIPALGVVSKHCLGIICIAHPTVQWKMP